MKSNANWLWKTFLVLAVVALLAGVSQTSLNAAEPAKKLVVAASNQYGETLDIFKVAFIECPARTPKCLISERVQKFLMMPVSVWHRGGLLFKDRIYRNLPLLITEFGIPMPFDYGFPP